MPDKHMALPIYEFLDTVGNQTGTNVALGDYSITAQDFKYTATEVCSIHRMIITIEDVGIFDAAKYGNGIVLTNGIRLFLKRAGVELALDGGIPIKTNEDWSALCHDVQVLTWGTGNEILTARFSFDKAGRPITLHAEDEIIARLNDTFVGLVDHRFMLQGHTGVD